MKYLMILFSVTLFASCSSAQQKKNVSLSERIEAEEVRSLQEIQSHANYLLETHPELDEKTKSEVKTLLDTTIEKQEKLKQEESKIFQLLLKKSFNAAKLSDKEISDKKELKKRLKAVYDEKSKNSIDFINQVVKLSTQKSVNNQFKDDMILFIRDFSRY